MASVSAEQYRDAMLALLPTGDAWPTEAGSDLGALFWACAEEAARLHNLAEALLVESLPSKTNVLLDEWEREWGLPGDCYQPTLQNERRLELHNKVTALGLHSRQFLIDTAAKFGYAITLTEYATGDTVPGHPEIAPADAQYVLQVNAEATPVFQRSYGSNYGEPYAQFGSGQMECVLKDIIHDHLTVIFAYN